MTSLMLMMVKIVKSQNVIARLPIFFDFQRLSYLP